MKELDKIQFLDWITNPVFAIAHRMHIFMEYVNWITLELKNAMALEIRQIWVSFESLYDYFKAL